MYNVDPDNVTALKRLKEIAQIKFTPEEIVEAGISGHIVALFEMGEVEEPDFLTNVKDREPSGHVTVSCSANPQMIVGFAMNLLQRLNDSGDIKLVSGQIDGDSIPDFLKGSCNGENCNPFEEPEGDDFFDKWKKDLGG